MMTEASRTAGSGGGVRGAAGEGRGGASGARTGSRTRHGSLTTVTVVPLWDRFRTGARG